MHTRYGEIDVLRAAAIVLMVFFHLVYDLQVFAGVNIDYNSPFWFWVGKASALLFILISGLANGFSRSPVRRGLKVLGWGMVITLFTYLAMPEDYVRFGILHFLGVTMVLYPLFSKLSSGFLWVLAVCSAALGFWLHEKVWTTYLFIPFGLKYPGFTTIDYYPLFPYIAVTFLGILIYRHIYAPSLEGPFPGFQLHSGLVKWLSRNSLGIYLIHQPLILGLIFFLKYKRII